MFPMPWHTWMGQPERLRAVRCASHSLAQPNSWRQGGWREGKKNTDHVKRRMRPSFRKFSMPRIPLPSPLILPLPLFVSLKSFPAVNSGSSCLLEQSPCFLLKLPPDFAPHARRPISVLSSPGKGSSIDSSQIRGGAHRSSRRRMSIIILA